jgi:hypothetical protein
MGSLMNDLLSFAGEFSPTIRIGWAVWLAWGIAQLVWLLWPRREAPLYRTISSSYSSSSVRATSRPSTRSAWQTNITPQPADESPIEMDTQLMEPETMRLVAAMAASAEDEAPSGPTNGGQAVVKSLVGGSEDFLAALGLEAAKPRKASNPNQSVYR